MLPSAAFLRVAAVCAGTSAVTTLGLIFLPSALVAATTVGGPDRDPAHVARLVVGLVHPAITLVGVVGVVLLRLRQAAGPALAGLVFFTLWAGVEMVQQALVLAAVGWRWHPAAATGSAGDDVALRAFAGIDDGLFLVILMAFLIANVALSAAMRRADPFGRLVGLGYALAALLGAISMATRFWGAVMPPGVMAVLYPLIQPPARLATGVWLWRAATGRGAHNGDGDGRP